MKKTPPLSDSLERLEDWLRHHRPEYLKGLAPGATTEELAQCERRVRMELPDDLRLLLKWHNGQGEEFVGYFEESWLLMGTEWIADVKAELDAQSKDMGWLPQWIPFLDNDQGDYLCLDDTRPKPRVCGFYLGKEKLPIVAESLAEWLADFVRHAEQGAYVEDQERGRLLRKTR